MSISIHILIKFARKKFMATNHIEEYKISINLLICTNLSNLIIFTRNFSM